MARRIDNPPNPWTRRAGGYEVEWLGEPPAAAVQVYEEDAKSILTANESPDVPFRWGVNAYRGCQHACAYCYARPGHQYLGFGAGTDFDTKIVVKRNAEALLRNALARKKLDTDGGQREWIAFSGVTDPYQPLEASYGLTRRMLEACREFKRPVGIITKSALVRRDIDVLSRLAKEAGATVFLSIPFASEEHARAIEPWAATPSMRFAALRALSDAGIPTGVSISPVVPGLTDTDIPEILQRAADAGATRAFSILIRLAAEVRPVFEARLRAAFPARADKVMSAIEDCRALQSSRAAFGTRMRGAGPRWQAIHDLFELHCRRLGLQTSQEDEVRPLAPNRRTHGARADEPPRPNVQGELF